MILEIEMRFNDIKRSVLEQFAEPEGCRVVPYITGCPGGGKSACVREIAYELQKAKGIPDCRVVEFNPSLRDPVDIMGVPDTRGEYTRWVPPEEFYALRHGVGPAVLIIEELSDATMAMQNPLCRVILDRKAGNLSLTDELYIMATGNRVEDRSGANRLSTKLANRMRTLKFETGLDDWCAWAVKAGVKPEVIGFLKFRPALLSDFDPKRELNPTPRAWADVSRVPMGLSPSVYYEHVAGSVGEGAASEFTAFLKVWRGLPDMAEFLKHPKDVKFDKKDPSVLYALVAKSVTAVTKRTFGKWYEFYTTLPEEFCVMAVTWAVRQCPGIVESKAFEAFSVDHADVLYNI